MKKYHTLETQTDDKDFHENLSQWAKIKNFLKKHRQIVSIFFCLLLSIFFWFTFQDCKLCVLIVFILSSVCCCTFPSLQLLFWPSLFVLFLNSQVLSEFEVKADFPVGRVFQNMISTQPSSSKTSSKNHPARLPTTTRRPNVIIDDQNDFHIKTL